jgi:cold-inducible RNA-binding protein
MLYNIFIKFGPISSLRILRDSQTKQSRGFGFVSFYNQNDAANAKNSLNHTIIL